MIITGYDNFNFLLTRIFQGPLVRLRTGFWRLARLPIYIRGYFTRSCDNTTRRRHVGGETHGVLNETMNA